MSCTGSIFMKRDFREFDSFDGLVVNLQHVLDHGDEISELLINCLDDMEDEVEKDDAEKEEEAKQVEAGLKQIAQVLSSGNRAQIHKFKVFAHNTVNCTPLLQALSACDAAKGEFKLGGGSFSPLDKSRDSAQLNSSLKCLRIYGATFKEGSARVLGLFRGIEDFQMHYCSFPNDAQCPDMKEVFEKYSGKLSNLCLNDTFFTTNRNAWLHHLPLFLPRCHKLKKLALKAKAQGPFLKELHLAIGKCVGFEELDIDLEPVRAGNDDGYMLHCVRALSNMKALKRLEFGIHKFHDTAVTGTLVDFLKKNRSLTQLSSMHFFPEALKLFIRGLAEMKGLQKVCFLSSDITDRADAEALIASLKANTTLTDISGLRFNFGSALGTAPAGAQTLESSFEKEMKFQLTLNRFGRPLFSNSSTSDALRAKILGFARHDANALFYFLRKMPSLAQAAEGSKRPIERARYSD